MPIYEYRCAICGHELEALQKLSDPALTRCPQCQAEALTKLVSAAGFQLKGSGWYVTDFRNTSKPGAAAKKAGGEATAPESKPDVKTETPADSKSEAASQPRSESKPDGGSSTKSNTTSSDSATGASSN
ncbi:MAG TPA: zinc ribbon domain-containing protein [Casimicrobiaceae bacterium]|nr:zinc ribbon domain-containing protein [Casimicrobiaceae bacterium]